MLVAECGMAGLRLAQGRRPRLVILEAKLPDMPGEIAVSELRNRAFTCAVPIVVLSSDDSPSIRARFVWAGANAYITKPLNVAQIDRTVGRTIGCRHPLVVSCPTVDDALERLRKLV